MASASTSQQGAITAVIGPNGAGKSSLFNLISGAIPPNAGRVIFRARRSLIQPASDARAGLARSFQIIANLFELAVRET